MPIADAAEKRALQQNQHPFGGFLDTNTLATGALGTAAGGIGSGDLSTGLGAGLALAAGRRFVAPKIGSSLAVTFDKVSKQLLKDPKMFEFAKSSPEAFKSIVYSFSKPLEKDISIGIQSIAQSAKGPEKWAAVGAENLISSGLSADQIENLKQSKKGQSILQRASDLKPNSKAMNNLIGELQNTGGD